MAKHSICYLEWYTTDLEKTKKFLGGLFDDWTFHSQGEGYAFFRPPAGVGGGLRQVPKVTPGKSPVLYVEVDTIEPYLKKAFELGGTVATAKTEIPGFGWYADFKDPDGNMFGIYENRK